MVKTWYWMKRDQLRGLKRTEETTQGVTTTTCPLLVTWPQQNKWEPWGRNFAMGKLNHLKLPQLKHIFCMSPHITNRTRVGPFLVSTRSLLEPSLPPLSWVIHWTPTRWRYRFWDIEIATGSNQPFRMHQHGVKIMLRSRFEDCCLVLTRPSWKRWFISTKPYIFVEANRYETMAAPWKQVYPVRKLLFANIEGTVWLFLWRRHEPEQKHLLCFLLCPVLQIN